MVITDDIRNSSSSQDDSNTIYEDDLNSYTRELCAEDKTDGGGELSSSSGGGGGGGSTPAVSLTQSENRDDIEAGGDVFSEDDLDVDDDDDEEESEEDDDFDAVGDDDEGDDDGDVDDDLEDANDDVNDSDKDAIEIVDGDAYGLLQQREQDLRSKASDMSGREIAVMFDKIVAFAFRHRLLDKALAYADEEIKIWKRYGESLEEARGTFSKGLIYGEMNKLVAAAQAFQQVCSVLEGRKDERSVRLRVLAAYNKAVCEFRGQADTLPTSLSTAMLTTDMAHHMQRHSNSNSSSSSGGGHADGLPQHLHDDVSCACHIVSGAQALAEGDYRQAIHHYAHIADVISKSKTAANYAIAANAAAGTTTSTTTTSTTTPIMTSSVGAAAALTPSTPQQRATLLLRSLMIANSQRQQATALHRTPPPPPVLRLPLALAVSFRSGYGLSLLLSVRYSEAAVQFEMALRAARKYHSRYVDDQPKLQLQLQLEQQRQQQQQDALSGGAAKKRASFDVTAVGDKPKRRRRRSPYEPHLPAESLVVCLYHCAEAHRRIGHTTRAINRLIEATSCIAKHKKKLREQLKRQRRLRASEEEDDEGARGGSEGEEDEDEEIELGGQWGSIAVEVGNSLSLCLLSNRHRQTNHTRGTNAAKGTATATATARDGGGGVSGGGGSISGNSGGGGRQVEDGKGGGQEEIISLPSPAAGSSTNSQGDGVSVQSGKRKKEDDGVVVVPGRVQRGGGGGGKADEEGGRGENGEKEATDLLSALVVKLNGSTLDTDLESEGGGCGGGKCRTGINTMSRRGGDNSKEGGSAVYAALTTLQQVGDLVNEESVERVQKIRRSNLIGMLTVVLGKNELAMNHLSKAEKLRGKLAKQLTRGAGGSSSSLLSTSSSAAAANTASTSTSRISKLRNKASTAGSSRKGTDNRTAIKSTSATKKKATASGGGGRGGEGNNATKLKKGMSVSSSSSALEAEAEAEGGRGGSGSGGGGRKGGDAVVVVPAYSLVGVGLGNKGKEDDERESLLLDCQSTMNRAIAVRGGLGMGALFAASTLPSENAGGGHDNSDGNDDNGGGGGGGGCGDGRSNVATKDKEKDNDAITKAKKKKAMVVNGWKEAAQLHSWQLQVAKKLAAAGNFISPTTTSVATSSSSLTSSASERDSGAIDGSSNSGGGGDDGNDIEEEPRSDEQKLQLKFNFTGHDDVNNFAVKSYEQINALAYAHSGTVSMTSGQMSVAKANFTEQANLAGASNNPITVAVAERYAANYHEALGDLHETIKHLKRYNMKAVEGRDAALQADACKGLAAMYTLVGQKFPQKEEDKEEEEEVMRSLGEQQTSTVEDADFEFLKKIAKSRAILFAQRYRRAAKKAYGEGGQGEGCRAVPGLPGVGME